MSERRLTGSCACGAVRIQAVGEPYRVGLCHCQTCRRHHGAPFGAFAMFPADKVEIWGGELGEFRSSATGRRCFCKACGSPVFSRDEGSDEIVLYPGSLDGANLWAPTYEVWVTRREGWLPELPTVCRRYAENRPAPHRTEP